MPTFGLVMIVKDAARQLEQTLPTLAPLIDAWTIVDTGSTDDTAEVIERFLGHIPGDLYEEPWVNFGFNRSVALSLAPETDWLILSDADMAWWIDGFNPDPGIDAYMVEMGGGDISWHLPLVVNGRRKWKSVGAVHELTVRADGQAYTSAVASGVKIAMPPVHASPEKLAWHAEMLLGELARDPGNARATFYLAKTYRELGRLSEAAHLHALRATMGGWEEEVYYSAWQAASLVEGVAAVPGLLAAWDRRPTRLEALADALRRLNAAGSHYAVWLLSDVPLTLPADTLFVHRGVWDWQITFERSIAAWWVGERLEFRRLSDSLLANPNLPEQIRAQVAQNMALP